MGARLGAEGETVTAKPNLLAADYKCPVCKETIHNIGWIHCPDCKQDVCFDCWTDYKCCKPQKKYGVVSLINKIKRRVRCEG